MMSSLSEKILRLFPTSTPLVDFIVSDNGNEELITYWGLNSKIPTDSELFAAQTPTQIELFEELDEAFDAHIDAVAAQRGYKRVGVTPSASCIGYAGYPNQYQAEAIKFGQWVADCCALLIAERAKVEAGTRTMPTPAEAIAELPPMVW